MRTPDHVLLSLDTDARPHAVLAVGALIMSAIWSSPGNMYSERVLPPMTQTGSSFPSLAPDRPWAVAAIAGRSGPGFCHHHSLIPRRNPAVTPI
jgi:hypothetical protein